MSRAMTILAQDIAEVIDPQNEWVGTAIALLVAFVLYWIARMSGSRFVRRMESKSAEQGARAQTIWTVLRRVVALSILIGLTFVLFAIWGWSLAPFIGLGTVLAAALGFGAQDLVKDFLSGFFMLMEDQFHVGDTVTIADTTGTVEDIQLRVTVLRDLEGNVHYVPNGAITVTSNFTSQYAQPVIDIGIAYEADVDRALEVLGDELRQLAQDETFGPLIRGEPEVLGVTELGDSSVVIRARITTVANSRWTVRREALRRIKIRFDVEGIPIPFPQITINRKST